MASHKPTRSGTKTADSSLVRSPAAPAAAKKKKLTKPAPVRTTAKPARTNSGATATTLTYNGIGDAAVRKATGKDWREWLSILDDAAASSLAHAEIASLLQDRHNVPDWWCQMVTVGYEQARGLRQKHQRPDGFQISASKTINVPIADAFEACANETRRQAWLPEKNFAVRKANAPKTIRATWIDKKTNVELAFTDKGPGKCQVVVQHSKIATAAAGEKLKSMWAARLLSLKSMLEG